MTLYLQENNGKLVVREQIDAPEKLAVQIPFSGFYGTSHDAMFEDWLEREQELLSQDHGASDDQLAELSNKFYDGINWQALRTDYAKDYCDSLAHLIPQENADGFAPKIDFLEMTSPREYNFETDCIYADISVNDLKVMLHTIPKEDWCVFVKEKCTSRSGFISFHSPNFDDWEPDLQLWGEARLGMVLEAYLTHILAPDDINESLSWSLMEPFSGNGGIDNLIFKHANEDFITFYESLQKDQKC